MFYFTFLLEENVGVNIRKFELGNSFLDRIPKPHATKEKTGKMDFIKIKSCASEDSIKRRQLTELEKYL